MSFRHYLAKPKTFRALTISDQAAKVFKGKDETWDFQKKEGKKLLYEIFRREPLVFRAIKFRANLAVHRGFKFITANEKAKTSLKEFLKLLHPSNPIAALKERLKNLEIDAEWSGGGFWHKIWNKQKDMYAAIKQMHPVAMDFKRDTQGKILVNPATQLPEYFKWAPKDFGGEYMTKDIPVDEIGHLKYTTMGDEFIGMSLIEPMYRTLKRYKETKSAIAHAIYKHASPLHDVIVGDEVHPPTKEMIDSTADEVGGLSYKTEYVHPPWIRVAQLESFSIGRIKKYTEPFIDEISACTGVPQFLLLGTGMGTNKATAIAQAQQLRQLIQPIQNRLSLFFEEEILKPIMEIRNIPDSDIPRMQWNDILPLEESSQANRIKILSNIFIQNKPLITWEEARELAGLPAREPGTSSLSESQPGIYLVKPHGLLIYEGDKKAIVKSRNFSTMLRKPLILVSDDTAYGVIELTSVQEIGPDEFKKLRPLHRVSDEEAKQWWPGMKADQKLYYYPFKIHEMFKKPVKVEVPRGVQTFIKDVNFLENVQRKSYG